MSKVIFNGVFLPGVVNYSRWEVLCAELQALPQDQQLSVLIHAFISPDVVGRFMAVSTQ